MELTRSDSLKKYILIMMAIILALPISSFATPIGFSGGVNNEYEYEEIVFITGEPIKFIGEVKATENERDDVKTLRYTFDLSPENKSIEGRLRRTVSYETNYANRNDKGQAIGETSLSRKATETIDIDDDTYRLEDYQFSKSDIIDKRPASDFYSGNIKGRKYYSINGDEGKVIIDISGGNTGYENFWGSTETQIIDYYITYDRDVEEIDDDGDVDTDHVSWTGNVRAQVSDSLTKELRYSGNLASLSSFNGGYVKVTDREIISTYSFDLPSYARDMSLSKSMVPRIERLIVPKFKDLGGHWAQSAIEKLYSLDVFEDESQFFTPNIPMTRAEFIRAIIKACDIRIELEEENTRSRTASRRRNEPAEESPFIDVSVDSSDYPYIKEGVAKGIISGAPDRRFNPDKPLTRAEAITIIVGALGFDSKAPTPGYYMSFADDRSIPSWARDSIYVANEIGIIQGDNTNRVNPTKEMTRAEASAMLVRFLEFLEEDLQQDYRENIILFN